MLFDALFVPFMDAKGFGVEGGAPKVKELDSGWKVKPPFVPVVADGKDWLAPNDMPPFIPGNGCCWVLGAKGFEALLPKEPVGGRFAALSLLLGTAILR